MTDPINTVATYDFERLRKRDRHVFRQVHDDHVGLLIYTALRTGVSRADAKDIAQDVFVKLWECIAQIDDLGALKTWLVVATRNRAIDYLRQQKNTKTVGNSPTEILDMNAPPLAQQADTVWHEIQVSLVGDIVEELCLEVNESSFRRFYVDGKSAKDIALENGEPISTVTNRLSRMRKTFKQKFMARLQALRDSSSHE